MSETDEREFERYLDGADPLSRRYAKLRTEQPPAELDTAVLNEAHEALEPMRIDTLRPARRWFVPVTAAAMVVLSFSLVMSIVFESEPIIPTEQGVESSRMKSVGQAETERADASQPQRGRMRDEARTAAEDLAEEDSVRPSVARNAMMRSADPEFAPAPPADAAAPAFAPKTLADSAPPPAPQMPASPPRPAAPDAPPAQPSRSAALEEVIVSAPEGNPRAAARRSAAGALSTSDADTSFQSVQSRRNPELWLEEIETLREEGEIEEAREELRQFREQWPDHPLPEELRELAERD